MRTLHVINSFIQAGVEVLLTEMVPLFEERGLEVTLATLKRLDSPLEQRLRDAGVRFLDLPQGIYSVRQPSALSRYFASYDVVQSYLFPSQLWVPLARALARCSVPLVTTEQNTTNRRRVRWFRRLDRWMYRQYEAIACNSEATLQALVQWLPELQPRVCMIPNGTPLERFRAAKPLPRAELVRDPAAPILAFTARFQPQKDHFTVLRAVAQVPKVQLLLIGDGELRPAVERLARELGIHERVHFLGRRSDIAELLKTADIYVHSSYSEGFGIAALEAMATGLPVIACNVPGLSEVVAKGGLLFRPQDPASLAERIRQVLSSESLRRELSLAAQARSQLFSIEACVDAYVGLYHSVQRQARPGRSLAT